jgi:hypothetical protein
MIMQEYLMKVRYEELLKEVEQIRLINSVKRHPVKGYRFYANSLAWLGGILCGLGNKLEKRFGDEVAIDYSHPIDRSLEV